MNRINAQVNNIFEKRRKNYLPGLLLPKIFQYREKQDQIPVCLL